MDLDEQITALIPMVNLNALSMQEAGELLKMWKDSAVLTQEIIDRMLEQQKSLWDLSDDVMADGTPIVDAPGFQFRRGGVWYNADGTPVDPNLTV